jgi:hypothetical protein
MKRLPAVACLAALLALAGCAALQSGPGPADAVIAEALLAARAPAAEQKATLLKAQEAFAGDGGSLNRLRLATLLVVLPAPLRDDGRAADLLDPLADAAAPGAGRLAALLAVQVAERQRLAREAERSARERAVTDKERDKREEALREQLEALRAIERGILEREEKLRKRQR